MNINKHNVAMRWITRRRTNEVAGLYESFPGTFSAYQEALSSGFQGTMEEFMQIQSIPQGDRPFTGKVGGLVEPGVTHYATKSYYQRMKEKHPEQGYQIKTKTFKIGDKTYKIGEAIKPNQIASLKEGLKKITQWKKDPTAENWIELFRTPSKTGQTHQSDFSLNLRKYLSDKKIPPQTKKLFDLINIKSTVGTKTANSIKTFQADNAFWKSAQTIKNIKIGQNVKAESMAHINAIRDAFVWDPDSELDDLAKFMYGDDFTKANAKQKLKIVNEISNDVPKFLEAMNGARRVKNFNMPNDNIALDIIDNIQSNKRGFKFKEGTLRNYKFNIRDADIMLPEGTTLADRNRLMKLKKGMGLAIDETGGLSATYQRAPGYTSGSQLIDNLLNKKKRKLIDKDFSNVLRAMVDGDPKAMYQWRDEMVTRDELVKNYNTHAEKFKKKYMIDAPTIELGVNPKKAVSHYGLYSKAEQVNMQNIFKTKKFSIGFGEATKPVKALEAEVANILNKSFRCGQANGISCDDPKAYIKSINEQKALALAGDAKAAAKFNKVSNAVRAARGISKFTAWGILGEVAFAPIIALPMLAKGESWSRIMGDISFGLFGETEKEELARYAGTAGAAQMKTLDTSERAQKLQEKTFPGARIGMDPKRFDLAQYQVKEAADQDFRDAIKPFVVNGVFDYEAFTRAGGDVGAARAQIEKDKLARKESSIFFQDKLDPTEAMVGFNTGGRVPLAGAGAVDKGRRAFMKWLAGITGATVAAGTGLIKFGKFAGKGKTVIKAGDHIIQGTPGMPDWFIPLINRITKEGDDVTKKLATVEREIVHTKSISKTEDVTVYQNLDTGNVRVEYGSPEFDKTGKVIRASNDPDVVHLEYRAPEEITSGKHAGKKTDPEFSAAESEPEVVNWDGDIEKSGINEVSNVDDLVTSTHKLKEFGKNKKLTHKDKVIAKKKQKYKQKLEKDTMEQIDYIEKKHPERPTSLDDYDDYLPDIDDLD